MTNFEMVKEWHTAFGVPVAEKPTHLTDERYKLRLELIAEEAAEYAVAIREGDLVEMADALTDLLYVTYGAMIEHGFPADDLFVEVQRSNMSKLGSDGKPICREDGKVLKGPDFSMPDIAGVLGWEQATLPEPTE